MADSATLQLLRNFAATHQTAGLSGFPAIDVFGNPGTPVLAPVGGNIVDVHMIPWNQQQRVGGETAYLQGANDRTYFLTHLGGNVPTGPVTAGQQIGTVGQVPGGWWQPHIHEGMYQGIYNPGGSPAPTGDTRQLASAYTAAGWAPSALLAYQMAIQQGATPAQAKDFASVQYGESGFDPTNWYGKSQGKPYVEGKTAAGLYQLLSQGYIDKAKALGGVFNPRANIGAILPDYLSYYRSHPGAIVPGAAGAAVEKSGENAAYYAQGYQHLPGMPTGGGGGDNWGNAVGGTGGGVTLLPYYAPAVKTASRAAFVNALQQVARAGRLGPPQPVPSKLAPITTAAPSIASANLTPPGDYSFQNLIKNTSY